MKNTTLARKPSNTMKKNQGTGHEPRRRDQAGDGADFAFNGQMGDGVNRDNSRDGICTNQYAHMVKNPDAINHGLIESNRRGNASDSWQDRMEGVGPSATRDAHMKTISTAKEARNPVESKPGRPGTKHTWPNPDAINVGMKR